MTPPSFTKRLTLALEAIPLMKRDVARHCGVRAATLSAWINTDGPERLPSGEVMLKLLPLLHDHGIDILWLLTGRGDMRRAPDDAGDRVRMISRVLTMPSDEVRKRLGG